ncbi:MULTISPECIES: Na+/H+ antiporter NhaA [Mediterranea]|uniref:Na+/H+ antiporter NhaA n=1 Tax=Mediterranea TaxID=1926659 RepID=UPI002011D45F|nr:MULTISPECIES: Na+/H+ antiporter NhaA [Mediterranea]MCL1606300.1 Na+/H+ antiporter NhaA [Mediterranea sp. ET5]MDM8121342.1 Na+/H+ antiporter NhaA [Mediterranea massiliensis]MDM8198100.1 Na+/H+ antiporter NhaA [Mediterranea massiliensis]
MKTFDYSFLSFLKHRVNGGMVLMIVAVLAMVVANSPWADAYHAFWSHPVSLQVGSFNLFSHHGEPLTLMAFINDALMAVFFFSVGLEIKREVLVGELSSLRQALLPIIAAVGGMLIPVLLYFALTAGTPAADGLAIPMATDIAFSLGVLSLFGKRVPLSLKIFLTAFAVVDDIGGILVIAFGYTSHLDVAYLLGALGVLLLLAVANRMRVMSRTFYCWAGIVVWYLFLQSGVHATIAGVLVAFTIPSIPCLNVKKYIARIRENVAEFPHFDKSSILLTPNQIDILKSIESASDRVISPLQFMEDRMHGMVNYLIMPLFAFANAGITLSGAEGAVAGPVTYAIVIGLVLGKSVGIYLFTWLAVRSRVTALPQGMNWQNVAGVSLLGGIGFTVSLFIANLSFGETDEVLLNQAKLGVLVGTVLAGVLGYVVLRYVLPKQEGASAGT